MGLDAILVGGLARRRGAAMPPSLRSAFMKSTREPARHSAAEKKKSPGEPLGYGTNAVAKKRSTCGKTSVAARRPISRSKCP
jgi:hypothetical protein